MAFEKSIAAGYVLFCVPKENQKGRRCPQGMKAPVGLLSRRPVCKANAACSARQGLRYFRGAGGGGLRLPASASCLGRHSHPAGRCPNSSSLFRPLAAVVAVANKGCSPLIIPKQKGSIQKIQVAALKDFLCSADWKPLSRCATAPPSGSKRFRKLCGLPRNFAAMPRALPLRKDFPRAGGRCRVATKGGIWRVAPERVRMLKLNGTLGEFLSKNVSLFHFPTSKS